MLPRSLHRGALLAATLLVLTTAPALAQTKVVETDFGPVEVPVAPTRIVTTHYGATQPLLDLGIVPVGQGSPPAQSNTPPQHWPLIADVPTVSLQGSELNYEKILELQPDLIIEVNFFADERLEKLGAIAPTMMVGTAGELRGQWEHRAFRIAEAVGRLDVHEQVAAKFAARQAEIAAQYGKFLADHPIALWAVWEAGSPMINPSNSMVGRIIGPAGAVFAEGAEALKKPSGEEIQISNEDLGTVLGDAAIIFYATDLALNASPVTEETRANANYQLLPAVQNGLEFPIGKMTIGGYGDAMIVLDHFAAALAAATAGQ